MLGWVLGDGWRAVGQGEVTVWAEEQGVGLLWGQTDRWAPDNRTQG